MNGVRPLTQSEEAIVNKLLKDYPLLEKAVKVAPKEELDNFFNSIAKRNKSDEINGWISKFSSYVDNFKLYNQVEFNGTVKVNGETRDVSRRIYQRKDIDVNYYDKDSGLTNLQLMKKGRAPIGIDGKPIQLHHLTQQESGAIVEILESTHQRYSNQFHGLVGKGESFRNNPILEKQYNNFRSKYWRFRYKCFNE